MQRKALGPYEIERELGSGGMGKVYAAVVDGRVHGLAEGTRVALKVVHPHLLETPGFFKRFLREAKIGKTVRHPNVVRTYDCDAMGTQHFMAMEYVEGQTLRELQDELGRVPEELCCHIGQEVAKGLAAIHAAGAIHRDMKPENVLITEDHVVKVMDLGVARLVDESLRLSQTGAFVGSLQYAAPECFGSAGTEMDGRVDLHALGLVLYELSCGLNPYVADGVSQTIERVLREEPRKVGDVNPQLSPFFEEVVHTLLEKDRENRFASADELASVLEQREESVWWRRRASTIRRVTKRPLRRVRIPRETAVYGRDDELAKLRALYDAAKAGEGTVVLIEGEAGIGKSRLVDELVRRLHGDGEEINFLFGSYPPGGAATAAGGFSTAYREQLGDVGCAQYLQTTPVLVPAFDALLRGEPTPRATEPLTKDSLQTCFVNATRALAAERPTVVLIDDLHFAPEEGRSLFTALAMAVPGHRVVLIGTTRRGMPEDWLAGVTRLDQTIPLVLQRLGPKDLVRLLQDTLRSDRLAQELSAQIAIKSDGNPFFVFEILQGLREGQFITQQKDGTWVRTKVIEHIQIPSSVLDLVNARVADLSEDDRHLLDVAACWGFEFDPIVVGEALGLARIPTLRTLGRIERSHLLVRSQGRTYAFDHHQVQESLYGALNEYLREEYHAALAGALESRTRADERAPETLDGALCVDLCEQYLKGARGDEALRYLEAAQTHLADGYLHAQVADLTERALAVSDLLEGAERARAFLRLGRALDRMGRRAREEEVVREAKRLADEVGDATLQREAATSVGRVCWRTARYEEAEEAARRALEIARTAGERSAEASVTGNLGAALWGQGRRAEAREHFERALALCHETGDRHAEATATGNLGSILRAEGHYAEAREHYERYLALCREIGNRSGEASATGHLGTVLKSEGRPAEARVHHERALALCREIGDRRGESVATGDLGLVCMAEGRLPAAQEHLEHCLALSREIGARAGEAIALHNLGIVHRKSGESARATALLSSSLVLCEEIGLQHVVAATHLAIGPLRAAAGDEEGARASLVAARDVAAKISVPGYETIARCHLACLPGGDAADALRAVTENDDRLDGEDRRVARFLLWQATGDRAYLAEAKRLLDEALAPLAEETRESMLANLPTNGAIVRAAREQGLD